MKNKLIVFALLMFVITSMSFAQTNYYVSNTGLDVAPGDGTLLHPWLTIQHAIDNSTGSNIVINVAAGVYTEQVTITKSLDLIGAGEATTTIIAPTIRTGTVTHNAVIHDFIIAAYATSGTIDVRVQGFTLDVNSLNKTAGTARLDGLFFRDVKDAGGTMAGLFSSTIHNFAATPDYESWGIAVYGDALLTVNDNDISDYTRDGLLVAGDGVPGNDPNVTISGNSITGSAVPLNGINIQDVAAGVVTNNTVSGHTRSLPWAAGGIVVWASTAVIMTGNHVDDNFYGIDLEDGSHNITISGNELTNNIKRGISINNSDNNTVSGNTITGPVSGTDDTAIGLANTSTGNTIGGPTLSDGNIITSATTGTGNLYSIYMQADVGAGSNTIQYNTINGGQRAVQFDGPPGITGVTTVSNNLISSQAFGGILAYNNGSLVITNNTFTNVVRPIEFYGPVDVTITGNTISGSTYAGINVGSFTGNAAINDNIISGVPPGNHGIWAHASGLSLVIHGNTIHDIGERGIQVDAAATNVNIDGNEIYNVHGYAGVVIDGGAAGAKINNNYIHNNNAGGVAVNAQTAEFNNNRIHNNDYGIEMGAVGATFVLRNNSIAGNDPAGTACTNPKYGVCSSGLSVYSGSANATNNWWGNSTGPFHATTNTSGTGNGVSDNVVYSPWFEFTNPAQPYTVGISILPTLSWTGGGAGATYEMDISTHSDFTSPLVQATGVTYSFTHPAFLANATTYYWRVRWTTAEGTSPWISNEFITVNAAKPTLNTISPSATSAYISWYPLPYSSGLKYDLYISDDNGAHWASPINTEKTYYTLPLVQGNTYKVQVRSTNSDGSVIISYSTVSPSFTPIGLPVPQPSYPTDPDPDADGLVYANPPTLFWYISSYESALSYEIEVHLDNGDPFHCSDATPIGDPLITTSSTKTFKKIPTSFTINDGATYKWQVRSVSGTGKSAWSTATAKFKMYTKAATEVIVPTPSWPVGNPTVYSNPPTLYWYLGEDKTGLYFNVKYTRVSDNTTEILSTWSQDLFKELPNTLIPGAKYTWSVRSSLTASDIGASGWSPVSSGSTESSFTIASTASGAATTPILSWPIGGAIVDGTMADITLRWMAYSTQPLDFKVRMATSVEEINGRLSHGSASEGGWVSATTSANANTITAIQLTAGATYYWQVKSRLTGSISVESPWSMIASFSTAAGSSSVVPLVVSPNYLQPINNNSAVLTWRIPVQTDSHLKYDLQYSKNPDFSGAVIKTNLNEPAEQITGLESSSTYYWRVLSKNDNGSISNYSSTGTFKTGGTTAVEEEVIPASFELSQNYPNPFNPTTRISFALPQNTFVSIKVYDMLGKEVRSLLNNEMAAGNHSVEWNGVDNAGNNITSGIYFYRIQAGNPSSGSGRSFISTKKMVLLK